MGAKGLRTLITKIAGGGEKGYSGGFASPFRKMVGEKSGGAYSLHGKVKNRSCTVGGPQRVGPGSGLGTPDPGS